MRSTAGRQRTWRGVALAAGIVAASIPFGGPTTSPAQAQTSIPPGTQSSAPNPEIADSCGTNVALVLDASGSIGSNERNVRTAGEAFLDALADTGSTARVLQFASLSEQLAPQTEVTAASLQAGGVFRTALNRYYNPKPPRPSNVTIHRYDGNGNPQSPTNWRVENGSNQYTNWDASLAQAGQPQVLPIELVLYITDGDPTAFDFDQAGDPFDPGPPPDVGMNTDRGDAAATTLDRAVQEANRLKGAGARMLAVGVGAALNNPQSEARLTRIAGPQVVRDGDLAGVSSLNDIDVALVTSFDDLAQFLRSVVNELCSPSLSIRKLAQSSDSADYLPAPDWDIRVTPSVTGGTFTWVLPDTDPAVLANCDATSPASRLCPTDGTGLVNFQWEPDPETANTSAVVEETLRSGWSAGRSNGDDWRCTLKNEDGSEEIESGDLTGSPPSFSLDVDPQQIITCNIYNSFEYNPGIELDKLDAPVQVRGDLGAPGSTVTSTFTVRNTGNAALSSVELVEDRCTPQYQSGDIGNDGVLDNDPAETWIYTCTRVLSSSPGTSPTIVTNTARVGAVDPAGTAVSDTATARVAVYAPAITLTKSASVPTVALNVPTAVTYNYLATNIGNMPLTDVTVKDDLGPSDCLSVAPVLPATPPITLAPGASQEFSCTTTLTATTTDPIENVADVVGTPQFPPPPAGISGPNGTVGPVVQAQAAAVVDVVDARLNLTKLVDKPVIFPNTVVTYTYEVANPGNVGLEQPGGFGAPQDRDGWIVDTDGPTGTCSPVTYVGGDADDDLVLDPGETWIYTCSKTLGAVPTRVVNTAEVVAEPVGGGTRLTRRDQAVVEVVTPAIEIVKAAVRPVVLDVYDGLPLGDPPGPIAGPDVPATTPAAYTFTVSNTGNVPIRDVVVADDFPNNTITSCAPSAVTAGGFNVGDANQNDLLDPGEAWEYSCAVRLTKPVDADGAPVARDVPGIVTNTASVTGEAFFGQEPPFPVDDTSTAVQVLIISPEARITKIPCTGDPGGTLACRDDLVVRPGTDVTYRYEFSNVGDTTLEPLGLVDDRCDTIDYVGGDTNGDGLVEGGTSSPEVWEYRCTTTINGPDAVVNTVDVFAVGPLGNLYVAEATATVRVFDPAIKLVKTARESLVPAGTSVGYDFVVTNAGASSLPADDVLAQISLIDVGVPAIPECATPTFVGGDTNQDTLLDKTETWRYECTATINADTVNVAGVTGVGGTQLTPPLPVDVVDVSAAFVGVFRPRIEVTKTANPTSVFESGEVTYTYEVRNTGDVPLADVAARITDDRCGPVTYVSGDDDGDDLLDTPTSIFEDAADEVWIFTCATTITTDTTNVVTVTGTPSDPGGAVLCATEPCDVTDTATATVLVQRGGSITIVKDADPNGATPFQFSGTLGAFELVDDGGARRSRSFANLAPGTYTVAESPTAGWQLDSITCVDPTNDSTVSLLNGTATILLGSGENVTCTFRNAGSAVVPPQPPTPGLPVTGSAIGVPAFLTGLALVGFGLLLSNVSRRRRPA